MQNLKNLLKRLIESDVDFVLVGGFAGVLHGSTQVTQDIDICAAITDEQIQILRETLKDLNAKHRMNPNFQPSFQDHPKSLQDLKNIYLSTDLGVLDIMSTQPPVGDFERIKKNAIEVTLYGKIVKVISIDDLIRIKESMSRPKDKEILQELLQIKKVRHEK